ncbi:hypothetical protein NSND_50808 [Nitrospira sp. ND1]|nr:hypothetical protein NSND_50808 [Nitrospira sp. ND1]
MEKRQLPTIIPPGARHILEQNAGGTIHYTLPMGIRLEAVALAP